MKFCSNCGTQIEDGARFCLSCGTEVEQPQPVAAAPAAPIQPAPSWEQPPQPQQYQQPYPQQDYAPAPENAEKPKKTRRIPIWGKILIGLAGAGIVATIVILLVVLPSLLKNAARLDYYKIADDQVPTVKLALDEERKVTNTSSAVDTSGVHTKIFVYAVDADQGAEMAEYADYLRRKDDFAFITDYDFATRTGKEIQLARNSVKDGYMVVVQLDWDRAGYTVSLMWGEGEVTPLKESPEPTGRPEPTDNPGPTDDPADPDVPMGPMTYGVQDESVTSIAAVLGEAREVIDSKMSLLNGVTSVTVSYSVPGYEQGLELNEYRLYLEQNEGFILLTDVNFNNASGSGVMLGRSAATAGYVVIVELEWDDTGYIIKTSYMEGSVTANGQPSPTPVAPPMNAGLPPLLAALSTGEYTYTYAMTVLGMDMLGAVSQQGDMYGTAMRFTLDGTEYYTRTVIRDGYTYTIDMSQETVTKMKSTAADLESLDSNYAGFVILDSGEGEVDGERLPYVEYGSADGESYGRHYLKNGDVYAIEMADDDDALIMIITDYIDEATASAFEIPADYTVIEY
jgi:hypothetical protein